MIDAEQQHLRKRSLRERFAVRRELRRSWQQCPDCGAWEEYEYGGPLQSDKDLSDPTEGHERIGLSFGLPLRFRFTSDRRGSGDDLGPLALFVIGTLGSGALGLANHAVGATVGGAILSAFLLEIVVRQVNHVAERRTVRNRALTATAAKRETVSAQKDVAGLNGRSRKRGRKGGPKRDRNVDRTG
jgi:hypothetical protein